MSASTASTDSEPLPLTIRAIWIAVAVEMFPRVMPIDVETRQIGESKPNNPRAIRLGERQLEGYLEKLNAQFPGEPWTGSVVTYP